MGTVKKAADIWTLRPTEAHRKAGAMYASRTLPWTFDRMMKNTQPTGQQQRALNIAKGIVVQEALAERLRSRGLTVKLQRKSHRAEDLFDFRLSLNDKRVLFDVKSIAYYSDYPNDVRPPFKTALVVDNAAYPGPDWRKFFPMMVTHTQIGQPKEGYIFAISESIDFRKKISPKPEANLIAAFPYAEHLPFFTYKKLCLKREEAGKGFYVTWEVLNDTLFAGTLTGTVLYEWAGKCVAEPVELKPGKRSKPIGPMSVMNCLVLDPESYANMGSPIACEVVRNEFKEHVVNSSGDDVNKTPDALLEFDRDAFCNLMLPDEFAIHVVGWIRKDEFLKACRQYPAWVWPIDRVDRYSNTPWSQITEKDVTRLTKAGLEDCIDRKAHRIHAGWMKTAGRGPGACCYVFPNSFGGGVKETNLYVLPQDLHTMDTLGR